MSESAIRNLQSAIDLSVVIVSYNVRELLEQCLESVARHTPPATGLATCDLQLATCDLEPATCDLRLETFVVDNASSDHSATMVREKFPAVQLIENRENRGFAAANNQAFAKARGRYVMMLNPDTVVKPGALEMLVQFMDAHPRAGACGGKLLYADGTLQHSAFMFPGLAQIFFDFFPLHGRLLESRINGRYPRSAYQRGEPFQIDHPLGADFVVRRETTEQVGWLDENFFIYCEEIDWAMRIKRTGWEIWCVPSAEIVHHEAQSTRQFRERMFVELWRARWRLFEKHYSPAFRTAARRLVRAGLKDLSRRARAEAREGVVTQEEAQRKLTAYAAVNELLIRSSSRVQGE
ncbi:MAG: glycosyltransferase family 2 protein [Chloroflexi bacterium]|nr:glycosyltransferase family 2 protein [Chloroflexota bacterium]